MLNEKVVVLCPEERVATVPGNQRWFYVPPPNDPTDQAGEDLVEQVIVLLSVIDAAWSAGEFARLERRVSALGALAEFAGMTTVANVAESALDLLQGHDAVAQAAVLCRLLRVGEASLTTLLDDANQNF